MKACHRTCCRWRVRPPPPPFFSHRTRLRSYPAVLLAPAASAFRSTVVSLLSGFVLSGKGKPWLGDVHTQRSVRVCRGGVWPRLRWMLRRRVPQAAGTVDARCHIKISHTIFFWNNAGFEVRLPCAHCQPAASAPNPAAPGGRPLPRMAQPGRKMLRSGSSALQRLTRMVGRSRQIYKVYGGPRGGRVAGWKEWGIAGGAALPSLPSPPCRLAAWCAEWLPGACCATGQPRQPCRTPLGSSLQRPTPGWRASCSPMLQGIVELCMLRYRDSESLYVGMPEAALCALRSQVGTALGGSCCKEHAQGMRCRHGTGWQLLQGACPRGAL